MDADLKHLPGGDLISEGLVDIGAGRQTVGALLVEIGASRIRRAGVSVPPHPSAPIDAELRLYALLRDQYPADAYSRYNAFLRLLISFEQALEREYYRSVREPI